ncbi:hypothetical protein Vafri_13522, partial [Volvox africanus]
GSIPLQAAVAGSSRPSFEVQRPVAATVGCRFGATPAAIASTGGDSEAEGGGVAVADHTINGNCGGAGGGGGGSLIFTNERLREVSAAARKRTTEVLAEVEAENPPKCISTGEDTTRASTDASGGGVAHGNHMHSAATRVVDRPPGAIGCKADEMIPEVVTRMTAGCPLAGDFDQQGRMPGQGEAGECAISTAENGHELCVILNAGPGAGMVCGFSTASGKPVVVTEASRKRAASWLSKIMDDGDEEEGGKHGSEGEGADIPLVMEQADAPNARKAVSACGGMQKGPGRSAAGAAAARTGESGLVGFSTAAGKPVLVSAAARKRAAGWLSKILSEDDTSAANEAAERVDCKQEAVSAAAGVGIGAVGMAIRGVVQGPGMSHADSRVNNSARDAGGGPGLIELDAGAAVSTTGGAVIGFSTANGKPVVISEAARRRAAGWMAKVLNEDLEGNAKQAGDNGNSDGSC